MISAVVGLTFIALEVFLLFVAPRIVEDDDAWEDRT